jgi:hypothetical protein
MISGFRPNRLLLLCFLAAPGFSGGNAAEPRDIRAYEITAITISRSNAAAGGYRIVARGRMRTGGYTNPRLRPVNDVRNGDLVLELVAAAPPPGSAVTMMLQPVSAEYRTANKSLEFVRVVGETNELRRRLPRK